MILLASIIVAAFVVGLVVGRTWLFDLQLRKGKLLIESFTADEALEAARPRMRVVLRHITTRKLRPGPLHPLFKVDDVDRLPDLLRSWFASHDKRMPDLELAPGDRLELYLDEESWTLPLVNVRALDA